jgi:hypothetical protein
MTDDQLKIVSRIAKTQDGKDFLDLILKNGQRANYEQILLDGKQNRDELVGYGNCLRDLVAVFENCDIRLNKSKDVDTPSWA